RLEVTLSRSRDPIYHDGLDILWVASESSRSKSFFGDSLLISIDPWSLNGDVTPGSFCVVEEETTGQLRGFVAMGNFGTGNAQQCNEYGTVTISSLVIGYDADGNGFVS